MVVSFSFLGLLLPPLGTVSGEGDGEWDRERDRGRGELVRRLRKGGGASGMDEVGVGDDGTSDCLDSEPVEVPVDVSSCFPDLRFLDI